MSLLRKPDYISPLWEPELSEVPSDDVEVLEQRNSFSTNYGKIIISCFWQPSDEYDPAFIIISWEADITVPAELRIRFVNPETQKIRAEVCLGKDLSGNKTFTSNDLDFDPSNERWALSVILTEE